MKEVKIKPMTEALTPEENERTDYLVKLLAELERRSDRVRHELRTLIYKIEKVRI